MAQIREDVPWRPGPRELLDGAARSMGADGARDDVDATDGRGGRGARVAGGSAAST